MRRDRHHRFTSRLSLILGLCVGMFCCSCATPPTSSSVDIEPGAAVLAAAQQPIRGTFRLEVRGSGRRGGRLYLNSEQDYRDQRCLTISIPNSVAAKLAERLGADPETALYGRTIRVHGVAQRVKIWFVESNGDRSDSYYYQTHVRVEQADQIQVP